MLILLVLLILYRLRGVLVLVYPSVGDQIFLKKKYMSDVLYYLFAYIPILSLTYCFAHLKLPMDYNAI